MKKRYCLLSFMILIIAPFISKGQYGLYQLVDQKVNSLNQSIQKKKITHKALGDTLYYEDFSDSTLSNWAVIDSNNMNFNWIWSNSAPGGMYSTQIGPLNSPTSSNGFLCLPADFYNTPMPGIPVPMNAWIISDLIPINPKAAVDLSYRQHLRYCCGRTNPMEVQVSSDSLNWTAFDAKLGRSASLPGPDGELITFNVNAVLGNEDTAYIRFRMTGDSHYFWMVDDLTLTEGLANALSLDSGIFDPFPSSQSKIHYSVSPLGVTCLQSFNAISKNIGANQQTNVRMKASVYMDSTIGGGPGQGLVYTLYSDTATLNMSQRKEFEIVHYGFYNTGHYRAVLGVESDSILQSSPLSLDTVLFTLTADTATARDYGYFNSKLGVNSIGNGQNGDKMGIILEALDSSRINHSLAAYSISVFISSDINNFGVYISPRIWNYNSGNIDSIPIGGSPFAVQIQNSMLDSWVTIPVFPPISLPASELLIGLEQTGNFNPNSGFSLGVDSIGSQYARGRPTYVYRSNSSSWVTKQGLVGIRLNTNWWSSGNPCIVGLNESQSSTTKGSIYPNPTGGQVYFDREIAPQELEVRDINGRLVYSRRLQEGQSSIDLSSLQNGLYFLHFKGEEERVEKIVIQH